MISVEILDATVLPGSVNLLRLSDAGSQPAIIARLYDDGSHGNQVPGDKTFTTQVTFDEPSAGQIHLVSAAFSGQLLRVTSSPTLLNVWPSTAQPSLGISISYPPNWVFQASSAPNLVTISNVQQFSEISLAAESVFQVRLLANSNPQQLPVDQWFDQHFSKGFDNPPISRSTVTIAGHPAVRIEKSAIGQMVHYYVLNNSDVIEISHELDNGNFQNQYQNMLNSMKFQ